MRTSRRFFFVAVPVCVAALSCLAIRPAAAEVVLASDLGTDSATVISSTTFKAFGFTTGTSTDFLTFQSVTASLLKSGDGTQATPVVRLFTNVSSNPGTSLTTLAGTGPVTSSTPALFSFTGSQLLSPSTTYWLVFSSANSGEQFSINLQTQPAEQNSSGWATFGGRASADSGTTFGNSSAMNDASVSVQAVPEPGTVGLAIAGLAACGLAFARRRMASGC
jgi:hypothetical protein